MNTRLTVGDRDGGTVTGGDSVRGWGAFNAVDGGCKDLEMLQYDLYIRQTKMPKIPNF